MVVEKALDNILNTNSKVKIIRLFISRSEDFIASGREISRLIGMTPPAVHTTLKDLYNQDILKRDIIGKQHIYKLNTNSRLVKNILVPAFKRELLIKKGTTISFKEKTKVKEKNVYIIAGSNGSGKTTFAGKFLPDYVKCPNFVNADLIAQGLSPFSPRSAALKAGRLVLSQIHEFIKMQVDFGFETTLSGKTYVKLFKHLKMENYNLHLFFLWIPSTQLALARIKDRVSEGGHNVPAEDVKRRFNRSSLNFFKLYKPLLDSWMLFNNAEIKPALIAKEKDGKMTIADKNLFSTITDKIGEKI
ncbi:MAG: zeta toxin family protein [Candidatus Auribacterota bacterium]|nr:zeta toxin family protein [Candidatus Auribacterota bacterium]